MHDFEHIFPKFFRG